MQRFVPIHRPDSLLYSPMVLLPQIVQVLAGSNLDATRKFAVFLHLSHRPVRGRITGITADTFSPVDIALVENRARIYKDRVVAGTEYLAMTDRDVASKSPGQVASILSPPAIRPGVRNVEVIVDLHGRVAVAAQPGKDLNIGTVTLTPAAAMQTANIDTTMYISAPNLHIVRK